MNNTLIICHFKNIIQHNFSYYTKIYTDASKSEHGVGFTVIKDEITIQYTPPKTTSMFTAEKYAIYKGIKLANTLDFNYH